MDTARFATHRSPWELVEELYLDDPWRFFVACLSVNAAPGHRAKPVLALLFDRWPDAASVVLSCLCGGEVEVLRDVTETFRPLGLQRQRALRAVALARVLRGTSWDDIRLDQVFRLPGCADFAAEAYGVFVLGHDPEPGDVSDHWVRSYVRWRRAAAVEDPEARRRELLACVEKAGDYGPGLTVAHARKRVLEMLNEA